MSFSVPARSLGLGAKPLREPDAPSPAPSRVPSERGDASAGSTGSGKDDGEVPSVRKGRTGREEAGAGDHGPSAHAPFAEKGNEAVRHNGEESSGPATAELAVEVAEGGGASAGEIPGDASQPDYGKSSQVAEGPDRAAGETSGGAGEGYRERDASRASTPIGAVPRNEEPAKVDSAQEKLEEQPTTGGSAPPAADRDGSDGAQIARGPSELDEPSADPGIVPEHIAEEISEHQKEQPGSSGKMDSIGAREEGGKPADPESGPAPSDGMVSDMNEGLAACEETRKTGNDEQQEDGGTKDVEMAEAAAELQGTQSSPADDKDAPQLPDAEEPDAEDGAGARSGDGDKSHREEPSMPAGPEADGEHQKAMLASDEKMGPSANEARTEEVPVADEAESDAAVASTIDDMLRQVEQAGTGDPVGKLRAAPELDRDREAEPAAEQPAAVPEAESEEERPSGIAEMGSFADEGEPPLESKKPEEAVELAAENEQMPEDDPMAEDGPASENPIELAGEDQQMPAEAELEQSADGEQDVGAADGCSAGTPDAEMTDAAEHESGDRTEVEAMSDGAPQEQSLLNPQEQLVLPSDAPSTCTNTSLQAAATAEEPGDDHEQVASKLTPNVTPNAKARRPLLLRTIRTPPKPPKNIQPRSESSSDSSKHDEPAQLSDHKLPEVVVTALHQTVQKRPATGALLATPKKPRLFKSPLAPPIGCSPATPTHKLFAPPNTPHKPKGGPYLPPLSYLVREAEGANVRAALLLGRVFEGVHDLEDLPLFPEEDGGGPGSSSKPAIDLGKSLCFYEIAAGEDSEEGILGVGRLLLQSLEGDGDVFRDRGDGDGPDGGDEALRAQGRREAARRMLVDLAENRRNLEAMKLLSELDKKREEEEGQGGDEETADVFSHAKATINLKWLQETLLETGWDDDLENSAGTGSSTTNPALAVDSHGVPPLPKAVESSAATTTITPDQLLHLLRNPPDSGPLPRPLPRLKYLVQAYTEHRHLPSLMQALPALLTVSPELGLRYLEAEKRADAACCRYLARLLLLRYSDPIGAFEAYKLLVEEHGFGTDGECLDVLCGILIRGGRIRGTVRSIDSDMDAVKRYLLQPATPPEVKDRYADLLCAGDGANQVLLPSGAVWELGKVEPNVDAAVSLWESIGAPWTWFKAASALEAGGSGLVGSEDLEARSRAFRFFMLAATTESADHSHDSFQSNNGQHHPTSLRQQACLRVSECFESGFGVEADMAKADEWRRMAKLLAHAQGSDEGPRGMNHV
ncbi:hypothetical protein DFJ74DRAFT_641889 [Hyaloraphidium curvatum]|nr:hypothetical protein DFJ74DRAFT_641889 [Hyaloraphidium curvatum]